MAKKELFSAPITRNLIKTGLTTKETMDAAKLTAEKNALEIQEKSKNFGLTVFEAQIADAIRYVCEKFPDEIRDAPDLFLKKKQFVLKYDDFCDIATNKDEKIKAIFRVDFARNFDKIPYKFIADGDYYVYDRPFYFSFRRDKRLTGDTEIQVIFVDCLFNKAKGETSGFYFLDAEFTAKNKFFFNLLKARNDKRAEFFERYAQNVCYFCHAKIDDARRRGGEKYIEVDLVEFLKRTAPHELDKRKSKKGDYYTIRDCGKWLGIFFNMIKYLYSQNTTNEKLLSVRFLDTPSFKPYRVEFVGKQTMKVFFTTAKEKRDDLFKSAIIKSNEESFTKILPPKIKKSFLENLKYFETGY